MSCLTVSAKDTITVCVMVRIDGEVAGDLDNGTGVFEKFALSPSSFCTTGSMTSPATTCYKNKSLSHLRSHVNRSENSSGPLNHCDIVPFYGPPSASCQFRFNSTGQYYLIWVCILMF